MKARPLKPGEEPRNARYAVIFHVIKEAIACGSIEAGLVLLEQPLAILFGTSRAPVRKALDMLFEEGLIVRFEGRGYLVSGAVQDNVPQRRAITRAMLGLEKAEPLIDMRSAGERIYSEIANVLSTCMVFGHYQVNEQRACEFYEVSRHSVREALMRLHDRGLVEKVPYSQWTTGPLTAKEVKEDYEMRCLLEPQALRQAAPFLSQNMLWRMLKDIEQLRQTEHFDLAMLDQIEDSLHQQCLAASPNRRMLASIRQVQMPLTINRLFYGTLGIWPDDASLREHRLVLELLLDGQVDAAVVSLQTHLERASERTLARIKAMSVFPEPEVPDYMLKLS